MKPLTDANLEYLETAARDGLKDSQEAQDSEGVQQCEIALAAITELRRFRAAEYARMPMFKMSDAAFVRAIADLWSEHRIKCGRIAQAIDQHIRAHGYLEPGL